MSPHVWVFDLDNTLYPAPTLYREVGARMTAYIARTLRLDEASAKTLRERYFHQYGATVAGLAAHHAIDAGDFLRDAHDVDYSVLQADEDLAELIAGLPGRKIVFTNGGGGHGARTLRQLGLDHVFERVFDIEDAGLAPKPQREAYMRMIEACAIDPASAMFVEDTLRNLEPAHDLGFTTILVGGAHPDPHIRYVRHWAPDVKAFLRGWSAGQG